MRVPLSGIPDRHGHCGYANRAVNASVGRAAHAGEALHLATARPRARAGPVHGSPGCTGPAARTAIRRKFDNAGAGVTPSPVCRGHNRRSRACGRLWDQAAMVDSPAALRLMLGHIVDGRRRRRTPPSMVIPPGAPAGSHLRHHPAAAAGQIASRDRRLDRVPGRRHLGPNAFRVGMRTASPAGDDTCGRIRRVSTGFLMTRAGEAFHLITARPRAHAGPVHGIPPVALAPIVWDWRWTGCPRRKHCPVSCA